MPRRTRSPSAALYAALCAALARAVPAAVRGLVAGALVVATMGVLNPAPAHADNPVTPGNFTGFGFDQCLAPGQREMDTWLNHSPFLAVGIYIAGASRGCREQPNLTPTWIRTQLVRGWRLLPITLGPQASCSPHFPRYGNDPTINPSPGRYGRYWSARVQGVSQGTWSVQAAQRLGISRGSVLWYDLEGFDDTQTHCRESALWFLSAWSYRVRQLGYLTGVYSSAGSGIEMLDRARIARRAITYPNYLWIARWDGIPNTSTSYISEQGWNPHRRVKQYQGGHLETWGGVTINIDRNWLDVGRGSIGPASPRHCGGMQLSYFDYPTLRPGVRLPGYTRVLQCLLKVTAVYRGPVHGRYDGPTIAAVQTWQRRVGATPSSTWGLRNWKTLLAAGPTPVLKRGSSSDAVRRVQRALNAVGEPNLWANGIFGPRTDAALRRWQRVVGLPASGVVNPSTWALLRR